MYHVPTESLVPRSDCPTDPRQENHSRVRRRADFLGPRRHAAFDGGAALGGGPTGKLARVSAYSAGAANRSSIGTVMGAACPRNLRQAILMSRNNLTQGLGLRKCDANSRFVSNGCQ